MVLVAIALLGAADPTLRNRQPFAAFLVAVLVTSRYFGFGPALMSVALSVVASRYLFISPRESFAIPALVEVGSLCFFVVISVFCAFMMQSERQARRQFEQEICERKRVESELRASQELFQSFMNHIPMSAYIKDDQGRYIFVNQFVEQISSRKLADWIGKDDFEVYPADFARQARNTDSQVMSSMKIHEYELRTSTFFDRMQTWIVMKFPFEDARGRRLLAGISMNVTERKDAEEAILAKQDVLKQLYESQENERRLVAFELHDGPIQYVTGAILHLDAYRASLADKPDEIELALHLLRKALEDSRRLMNGIRPPVLDESGLIPAIEQLIAQEDSGSCKIEFVHDAEISRFAPSLESVIYRIVQEGLTNARKHSRSETIRIALAESDRRVRLEIQDWGTGFDQSAAAGHRGGLKGFAERVRLAGGELTIETAPGKGTRILVELPVLQPV